MTVDGQQCSFWKVVAPCNPDIFSIIASLPCSPDGGLINSCHWRKAFSCLGVTPGYFEISQTITCLCVIFVGQPLLWRVTVGLNSIHLYSVFLTVDWRSPYSLEMVLLMFPARSEHQQLFFWYSQKSLCSLPQTCWEDQTMIHPFL